MKFMNCQLCKKPTHALFYPRHKTQKKPSRGAWKVCQDCLKTEPLSSMYAVRRELDKKVIWSRDHAQAVSTL